MGFDQNEAFSRSRRLIGSEALNRLQNAKVAVIGLGGVGSYAAEALARSGVGHLVLVDHDTVAWSNLNRQLAALTDTVDRLKTDIMAERIVKINPQARVQALARFVLPGCDFGFLDGCGAVVDAIDTVSGKVALAAEATARGIYIISAMGCGNRLNPGALRVGDIMETAGCPLCRAMRAALRKAGVDRLPAVYSTERALTPRENELPGAAKKRPGASPASMVFVPACAGMLLAVEVSRHICGEAWPVGN